MPYRNAVVLEGGTKRTRGRRRWSGNASLPGANGTRAVSVAADLSGVNLYAAFTQNQRQVHAVRSVFGARHDHCGGDIQTEDSETNELNLVAGEAKHSGYLSRQGQAGTRNDEQRKISPDVLGKA